MLAVTDAAADIINRTVQNSGFRHGAGVRIAQEVFGPVLSVVRVQDLDEAVEVVKMETPFPKGLLFTTGTPSGVGFARKPPVLLQSGDGFEVEIRSRLEEHEAVV